jgi:hypothetical protein
LAKCFISANQKSNFITLQQNLNLGSEPVKLSVLLKTLIESTMDVRHKMETSDDTLEPIQDIMSMKNMLLTTCYEDFMVVFASTSGLFVFLKQY